MKQEVSDGTLRTIDFQRLLDAMRDAVWIYDENYRTVLVNRAGAKNVLVPREELLGKTLQELFPGVENTGFFTAHQEALTKGRTTTVEGPFNLASHKKGWFQITTCRVPDGVLSISTDITKRKRAENKLRYSRSQLRALAARLQSIREEERTRIAREIHDELGMLLTGVKIDLSWLANKAAQCEDLTEKEEYVGKIRSVMRSIDTSVQIVRRVASDLRPGILDDVGLTAAIEWQTMEFQNKTGVRCIFQSCNGVTLDKNRSTALFRIFQEILTNISRHSGATKVETTLQKEKGHVVLQVQDNGRGISDREVRNPHSLGLLGMRERVLPYRGEISIQGSASLGTMIRVSIPCRGHG